MDSTDQIKFIRRIRSALGHPPETRREPPGLFADAPSQEDLQLLDRIRRRSAGDRRYLLERLAEAGIPIRLGVTPAADARAAAAAIVDLIEDRTPEWGTRKSVVAWRHPLVAGLQLEAALAARDIPLHVTEQFDPAADALR